jgi:4-diphosphocytidyl-2-C-methyl-D-erythritol kinase
VIVFPNCKINLGLRVLRKRSDSYHDLETVFYPLPFYDVLELLSSPGTSLSFTASGLTVTGDTADNLCVKAYALLKKDFPGLPAAQMHLHKAIPAGAGLGGGSADAAYALQLINKKFGLQLSPPTLVRYALELGSDCPFFIVNQPCLARGRGEELMPIELDISAYRFILVNPGIPISTGRAFMDITPAVPEKPVSQVIRQPVETWKEELVNDFESPVFTQYPTIRAIKEELYRKGAIYASLSGSGSTVYGLFPKDTTASLSFDKNYFIKELAG